MFPASEDVKMIAISVLLALIVIGIPAAFLKLMAGSVFAARRGVIGRSIGWGIGVGIAVVVLHLISVDTLRDSPPATRERVLSLGGWTLTLIEAVVLAVAAVGLDYWLAVRPVAPRLATSRTVGYLVVSNAWVLGGAFLILQFNAVFLYPSCIDPTTNRIVEPFYESRPANCKPLSD